MSIIILLGGSVERAVGFVILDLLKVEGLDQREELVHGLLQAVVDQAVREQN